MKKRKRGISSLITSVLWLLGSLGVILAIFQASGATSIEEGMQIAKDKASHYAECIPSGECGLASIIENLGDNSEEGNVSDGGTIDEPIEEQNPEDTLVNNETPGYRGPSEGEPYVTESGMVSKDYSISILENIKKTEKYKEVDYSRSEWKHWSGAEGRSCWNTRDEILYRDAVPGTLVFINKSMEETDNYEEACAIGRTVEENGKIMIDTEKSGLWIDPYSGTEITSSSDVDIDHIIPLSYAAKNGGQDWSEEKKEEFANDPENLLATSAKENRSKGDKGPSEYIPPYKPYRCQYAKSFTFISNKYNLNITNDDYEALKDILNSCSN